MTLLLAFLLMLLTVGAMAIGVIMGRKPIAGSCGGIKALGLDAECEVCGGDPQACNRAGSAGRITAAQAEAASLGSDVASESGNRDVRTL